MSTPITDLLHSPSRTRASLLIVEDEPCLREALKRRFSSNGYRVRAAASIAEARQQLRSRSFDVFVVDVGLPDGDGLSLLDEARAANVLVISAEPRADRFEANGVQHFLAKPFDLSEAARRVDALPRAGRGGSAGNVAECELEEMAS